MKTAPDTETPAGRLALQLPRDTAKDLDETHAFTMKRNSDPQCPPIERIAELLARVAKLEERVEVVEGDREAKKFANGAALEAAPSADQVLLDLLPASPKLRSSRNRKGTKVSKCSTGVVDCEGQTTMDFWR